MGEGISSGCVKFFGVISINTLLYVDISETGTSKNTFYWLGGNFYSTIAILDVYLFRSNGRTNILSIHRFSFGICS